MKNIPEYTVTQLNLDIKNVLEKSFEYVSVIGECGPITIPKSGHAYFSIKENDEVLSCICWKGNLERLDIKIEEGVEYNFFGRITSFAKFGRSGYQLIIDQIEFSGEGSILKLIEDRRKYFDKLGYFDPKVKMPIPKYPGCIAVITSPTGAVIRDIIQRVTSRYPLTKLLICPITVQGKSSHIEIIEYLNLLSDQKFIQKPSLVIFARGGGSLEEMMPFNEPELIENVFKFKIPSISAIGHETDFTLLDYVADLRAPTPSAAAEMATPDQNQIYENLERKHSHFNKSIKIIIKNYTHRTKSFKDSINVSIQKIFMWQERVSKLINSQINNYQNVINVKKEKIQTPFNSINQNNPYYKIKEKTNYLNNYTSSLNKIILSNFDQYLKRISFQERIIKNSSMEKNLSKGYSLILNNKKLVKNRNELKNLKTFTIKFKDGDMEIEKK